MDTRHRQFRGARINEEDFTCGLGSCRPKALQKCNNMTWFAIVSSLAGFVTSALVTYVDSQITTLEKHFNISSSLSGFLASCNDIGYLATTLFLSYITRRVHIPRGLALTCVMYGLSGLFCTLAFVVTRDQIPSPPTVSSDTSPVTQARLVQACSNDTSHNGGSCTQNPSQPGAVVQLSAAWRTASVVIIAAGMMLQGVAKSPRHAFIGTYIDDNVRKTKTTLYLGFITGISTMGPSLAFVFGGVFSSMYITLEETNMSRRDPRWLGAWWLGFLVFGVFSLVVALPLIFFPRHMNRQHQPSIKQEQVEARQRKKKSLRDIKGFLRCMLRLSRKPAYIFTLLGRSLCYLAISGMVTFSAKYYESQFTITAVRANIAIGILNLVTLSVGTIISGCLTSRLKLSPLVCLKLVIGSMVVVTVVMFLGFFVGCQQPVIYAGSQRFSFGEPSVSQCLQACNCDHSDFFPVCGSDGKNYFSPCHAGCSSVDRMTFSNCSCLETNTSQTAKGGLCAPDCANFYPYIALVMCLSFFLCVTIMPLFVVIVRSVEAEDIPAAIGFNVFAGTLLGFLPGPVIFGYVVDTACILWEKTCTFVGACALYDIELFRFRYHLLIFGLNLSSVICFVVVLVIAKCSRAPVFQPHVDEQVSNDEGEGDEMNN
ncbi:hypothetical protein BsWGS_14287 [Bradybaena similaris]